MAKSLDSTYGVAFVTLFLSTALYGMGILQAFLYFHWYPKDRWTLKAVSAFFFDGLYLSLITNFGNGPALDILFWYAQLLCGVNSTISVASSLTLSPQYFGHCLHLLNPRQIIVPALVVILGLVSLATAIGKPLPGPRSLAYQTTQLGHFSRLDVTKPVMTTQSASILACDVVITTALVYTMRGKKGDIKSTNSMLTTLMVNAVSRGFLTALCALLNLILFLVKPNTFYFFIGLIMSGKLYMNSLLATLNQRDHVRNKGREVSAQGWNSIPLAAVSGSNDTVRGQDIEFGAHSESGHGVGIAFKHSSETDAKRAYVA
ncbi:hypothetical protein C8R46DRAFT_1128869 [Mycena filopes]|nr:hypothetical protein C8R46DRAFT_1128869 [Mycena filopes]